MTNVNLKSIELFAGCGGLALGLEEAGLSHILLNEIDKNACATLRKNRPNWNVVEKSISEIDFSSYYGVDLVSGGFPCQAFSYAGKRLGFEDVRGTMFFEFARAINEAKPKMFLGENVAGLLTHDKGRTIATILSIFEELGYDTKIDVLNAVNYGVPQKRKRAFIVGIKKDLNVDSFTFPPPSDKMYTIRDALKKGELYSKDCPISEGATYSNAKKRILSMVPPGGCWVDLPVDVQKEYMGKSYYSSGGRRGVARRLSYDEPSLTLTCSPCQKQTERCHPEEVRPLTIREYARIQTFPDDWEFCGPISSENKQIGNAVPKNLAYMIGKALSKSFKKLTDL